MDQVNVVILAAGLGTRLGMPFPKPMTRLLDGRSIMSQQFDNINAALGPAARVTVVVGFKHGLIMDHVPDAVFVYNEHYDVTNTNRSLLKALRASPPGPVLWMNGDVVFDASVLERLLPFLEQGQSAVAVNCAQVAEEEVKYTVDRWGHIALLSKSVPTSEALGEAVGINLVSHADRPALIRRLEQCADQDYFERGLELAIALDGMRVVPVDISDLFAVEVDTGEDLRRANSRTLLAS